MSYLNGYSSIVVNDPGGESVIPNKVSYGLVQRGNQMFALGGLNGSNNSGTIEMITFVDGGLVSPNGGLFGWKTIGNLPALTSQHAAVMVGDFIYVVGGMAGSGAGSASNQVVTIRVESNGFISGVYNELAFPVTIVSPTMVTFNNRLYVMGGSQGGTPSNVCWFCDIGGNGRPIGNWQQTAPFPDLNYLAAATVTYTGIVMVTGGNNNSTTLNTVYTSVIQSNGQLGAWSVQPVMSTARQNHSMVGVGSGMWVFGGYDSNSNALSSIEYCDIDSQGRITQAGWSVGISTNSTLFVPSTTGGDGITYTAVVPGAGGSAISITYNAPTGGTTIVAVVGTAITVTPMTGEVNSGVVTAIQGSVAASALVTAVATGPGDAVVAFSTANLSGGVARGTTLLSPTALHASTVVDNGEKIYVVGGRNQGGTDIATPQLFKRY